MPSITVPFTVEQLHTDDPEQLAEHQQAAAAFQAAATVGVLMSLGATTLRTVPGTHQLGGLLFIAHILPMTSRGRGEAPRRMAVMVSLTGADLIDIDVRRISDSQEHATIHGIYIDQLEPALLSLDYDGPETLNPRLWTN